MSIHPATLLDCGDWACAHCNSEGLQLVIEELSPHVNDIERGELAEAAWLTRRDMLAASSRWTAATQRLRERLHGPTARAPTRGA